MRVYFISISLLISAICFAQPDSSRFLIDFNAGAGKSFEGSGVELNEMEIAKKSVEINLTGSYFVSKNIFVGAGIHYVYQKQEVYSKLYLMDFYAQASINEMSYYAFMPKIFTGYKMKLANNLYLNTRLQVEYANFTPDYFSLNAGRQNFNSDSLFGSSNSQPIGGVMTTNRSTKVEMLISSLKPSIVYYFNPHIGFNLELGGAEYVVVNEWDLDKNVWQVSFYPSQWNFGLQVCF